MDKSIVGVAFLKRALIVVLCIVCMGQAYAEAKSKIDSIQELSLEDILNLQVDIASTHKKMLKNTPSTVTIINKADLESYNYLSLAEALETISGISIYRTYFKRDLATSRGIVQDNYANKVLILINKTPMWNAVTGEGNLERIAISDIERIEILRGPASVIYGTNAYTGVINIVLKQSTKPEAQISTAYGQYNLKSIGANYSSTQGELQVFASAHSKSSDGIPTVFTGEEGRSHTINEYINSENITASIQYKSHSILLNTFQSEESFLGVVPSYESGAGYEHKVGGSACSYLLNKKMDKTTVRAKLVVDWQKRSMPRTASHEIHADIVGYKSIMGAGIMYQITKALSVEAELDSYYRHSLKYENYNKYTNAPADEYAYGLVFDGNNNMANVAMWEHSRMLQFHYTKGRFATDIGCRYTFNKETGNNLSRRVALVLEVTEKQSMKLLYGESYRSPSLFETNFEYPAVLGNPDLKPETSRSMELAYMGSFNKLFTQVTVYHAWYDNRIYREKQYNYTFRDTVIDQINVYSNGAEIQASGAEVELSYRNPKLVNLFLNADYICGSDAKDTAKSGNLNFIYVPSYNISAGISKPIRKAFIASVLNYYDGAHGPFAPIAAQYTVDVSVGIAHDVWGKPFKHSIFIKNVGNSQRQLPEYARREVINTVPSGYGRYFGYTLTITL